MKLLFCVVFGMIALVECEDDGEEKIVQRRGTYYSKKPMPDEDSRDQDYPNDFSIMRTPRPEIHDHHHYHNGYNHYHGGPQDFYHNHQHGYHNPSFQEEEEELDYNSINYTGIPLDFAKSVNEYIVSDLLLNYIEDVPESPEKPYLASRFGEEDDGNKTERNSASIARPAKCMPELTTVKIAESKDPNIFYIPECTRIERCGGCCSHILLSCQPTQTETVTFSVMKTEYSGGMTLKYVGKEPILVEKHTKCKCGCKIKAKDCNVYQEYSESDCRCVCKNIDEEKKCYKNNQKKLWNTDICACQCREVSPCSTNYQFDYNECRCTQSQIKRRYVLSESRKEQPEPAPEESSD